jgi:uncharacterized protein YjiS (DUF1127 family)
LRAQTFNASPAKLFGADTMSSLTVFGRLLERRSRMARYRSAQNALEAISEADLADMGMKRYQLGHAARVQAFK